MTPSALTSLEPTQLPPDSKMGGNRLTHQVLDDFAAAQAHARQWDALAAKWADLYCTYDWCRVWWKYYGQDRQLQLHLFWADKDELVAILPLFIERARLFGTSLNCVRVLGCDHTVTTCSVALDTRFTHEVFDRLLSYLDKTVPWDVLNLGPLAGYFPAIDSIAAALTGHPAVGKVDVRENGPQILIDLPESFDAYVAGLRGGERNNIRRRERHLREEFDPQTRFVARDDLEARFPLFVEQHQRQWHKEGQLGHFQDWPQAESFHKEMAHAQLEHDRLKLLYIQTNQGILGFQYNYCFAGRIYWILGSRNSDPRFDPVSPGQRLHCETVRSAIPEGLRQIDCMRGMYEYKLRLGGRVVQMRTISAVRNNKSSAARVARFRRIAALLNLLYYRIWYSRIAPKLPALRQPLWIRWIRSRL